MSKTPRILVASIALFSLVGMAAPAEAAKPAETQRTVWCC